MSDARFSDSAEQPVRLRAESVQDLEVISALLQDAVGRTDRVAWTPRRHRFTALLNRFRWEDAAAAARQKRPYERVQALLVVDGALKVRAAALDPTDRSTVLSLLALDFEPGAEGAGVLRLRLAGGAEMALDVECLDVTLMDVSRPYQAQSAAVPRHDAG